MKNKKNKHCISKNFRWQQKEVSSRISIPATMANEMNTLLEAVAEILGATPSEIKSAGRESRLIFAREMFVYYLQEKIVDIDGNIYTFKKIGYFIHRAYSTLIDTFQNAVNDLQYNKLFRILYTQLLLKLEGKEYFTFEQLQSRIVEATENLKLRWYLYQILSIPISMRANIANYRYASILKIERRYAERANQILETINVA
jgi:hypothetical protein